MGNKLVSIIILSYKNLNYLKETIDSTLDQDYKNIQLIIGDDGSPDFDCDEYENYINLNKKDNIKDIIVYKNTPNIGTVRNLNKAIKMSDGEYIKWMAADDTFYDDNVISRMIDFAEEKNSMLVATNIQTCDYKMREVKGSIENIEKNRELFKNQNNCQHILRKLVKKNLIDAPGILYTKKLFDKLGLFDEDYILLEDWPMWIKIYRYGCKIDYLDIISVKYRGDVGITKCGTPNPILSKDIIKCIEKEILPYKHDIGYWLHKNINYQFIREHKFNNYTQRQKTNFLIKNLDILIYNQLNKLNYKVKGKLSYENC